MDDRQLWGTVEMLLLEVIARRPSHGYAITQEVLSRSKGYFELKEGSLYPALHRLERQQLLKSSWEESEGGRRRKVYRVTPGGAKALRAKRESWERFSAAVEGVMGAAHARPA